MSKNKNKRYIHNYDVQYNAQINRINKSEALSVNKKLVLDFERNCFIKENSALPTRVKYLDVLTTIATKYIEKEFNKFSKKEIEDLIYKIEKREDITISTKAKYKTIIKKFGKYLELDVDWIKTGIKAKDRPLITASEILSEEEIEKLIKNAEHPRDKAFISVLYESGARIGEIGLLPIKSVSRDEYSFLIDLEGKTGIRTVRLIFSEPYLATWLNQHPFNDDPESPVWVMKDTVTKKILNKPLNYRALYKVIERLVKKVGIKKRVHPHLLRHSRVTHLLKNKQINESQAKVLFGWTPASNMLANYSHLVSADVNETLLEINGIKKKEQLENRFRSKSCMSCKKINSKEALFCQYCSKPLDYETIEKIDNVNQVIMEKIRNLSPDDVLKVLARSKGLK